jgi:hypothetical protein
LRSNPDKKAKRPSLRHMLLEFKKIFSFRLPKDVLKGFFEDREEK